MKEAKETKALTFKMRFSKTELEKIKSGFSRSTSRNLTDYMRKLLLNKPVIYKVRNESLDAFMAEMITLIKELNAVGNNYNQLVKRLHSLKDFSEIKAWLLLNESARKILFNKVDEIKSKIYSINDQWLQ
jgi:hypothetical protein